MKSQRKNWPLSIAALPFDDCPAAAAVRLHLLDEMLDTNGENVIAEQFLSHAELQRFKGFSLPKRKREWLGGRIAAKNAIMQAWPNIVCDQKELSVTNNDDGRPILEGNDRLRLSISHSGSLAVAMAAFAPCGIDIQEITPKVAQLRRRFLHLGEEAILSGLDTPGGDEVFLTCGWAIKEAMRKVDDNEGLPGFLEMRITDIKKERIGWMARVHCRRETAQATRHRLVRLALFEGSALAMTGDRITS